MHQFIMDLWEWLASLGYFGIMLGLMVEVIPSEIVLGYAGMLVARGDISMLGAIAAGTVGATIAQIFLYWIGRYGGRPFLLKYGKYILIKEKYIDISERWFNKYGMGIVFTARFVPVMRQVISIPAGITRMPLLKFTVYTMVASAIWSWLFVALGKALGDNWEHIDEKAAPYILPMIIAAVVLTVLYIWWKLRKREGKKSAAVAAPETGREGEQDTAQQLKFIGSEYEVMRGLHLKANGSSLRFEHLVVGPNGIFLIDSKKGPGEIKFPDDGAERSSGAVKDDPTAQLYRYEYIVKELLRAHSITVDVVGVICFTHPHVTVTGQSPAFATLKVDRLAEYIKTYNAKKSLDAAQVREVAQLLRDNSQQ